MPQGVKKGEMKLTDEERKELKDILQEWIRHKNAYLNEIIICYNGKLLFL